METEGKTNKGNAYKQSGNFGISDMSGGEIKDGAKVAGVINEGSSYNYYFLAPLPLFMKLLGGFLILSTSLTFIFYKLDGFPLKIIASELNAEKVSENSLNHQYFNLKYPSDWNYEKVEDVITGEVIRILPNQDDQENQSYLSVIIEDLSQHPLTLSDYTDKSIKEITKRTKFPILVKFIEKGSTTFAHRQAYQFVYLSQVSKVNYIKNIEVWTVYNNKAYIIHYKAREDVYRRFSNKVERIIKSFEISNH